MITFKHHKSCIKYIIKRINDTYLFNWNNATNCMQAFHEPPSLRPRCSSLSAVGHPRAGTNLHWVRNPRLGKVYRKNTCKRRRFLSQEPLMPTAHRLSFPTCLSHPRNIHLLCHLDSPSVAKLPCIGLQQ